MKANNQLACIIFFFTFQLVISVSHINIESPPPLLPQPKKKKNESFFGSSQTIHTYETNYF